MYKDFNDLTSAVQFARTCRSNVGITASIETTSIYDSVSHITFGDWAVIPQSQWDKKDTIRVTVKYGNNPGKRITVPIAHFNVYTVFYTYK